MNSKKFHEILSEIDKIQNQNDIIIIKTTRALGFKQIKGSLIQRIVFQLILDDGIDTDDQYTRFRIKTLNGDVESVSITDILQVEVKLNN